MDFQFTHYLGQVIAKCSMEHEALAHWLNSENPSSPQIQHILKQIQQLKIHQDLQIIGKEYSLFINADEVVIRANNLAIGNDEILEDDFHFYDEESLAFCGTMDFIHFLQSYLDFIQGKNHN
ncbi:UPF0231 family protein [[Haemophilus] felis]|nr:UPF0231 family protein [[Haemophilus] felis]